VKKIIFILTLIFVISGCSVSKNIAKVNKEFYLDSIDLMYEVYQSRNFDLHPNQTDKEVYEMLYIQGIHLENAKNIISKWLNEENKTINEKTKKFILGIEKMEEGNQAALDFSGDNKAKMSAFVKISLDEGEQIIAANFYSLNKLKLLEEDKKEIIHKMLSEFKSPLDESEKFHEENGDSSQYNYGATFFTLMSTLVELSGPINESKKIEEE